MSFDILDDDFPDIDDIEEFYVMNDQKKRKKVVPCATNLKRSNVYGNCDLLDYDLKEGKQDIDLSSFRLCTIIEKIINHSNIALTVKDRESDAVGTVTCSGFWKNTQIEAGQSASIKAVNKSGHWIIDNSDGFLVNYPDTLISSTTVVGSLFCARRGIFNERFKGFDSLFADKADTPLIVGMITHELFQKALQKNVYSISKVTAILDECLQSRGTLSSLYNSGIKTEELRKLIEPYVPKICEFVEYHTTDKIVPHMNDDFKGKIKVVHDIEENIWLPELGIKGKIDVTVEVGINSRRRIMPLELKTGRPTFSLEHKGQVTLYCMLMSLTGHDVDTGLLLYIRDNIMREMRHGHPERRDLIVVRNNLAHYLDGVKKKKFNLDSKVLKPMEIPEPISFRNACVKCSYNRLCCAYLNNDSDSNLSEQHPLRTISKEILSHLPSEHINYIMKWILLLEMEDISENNDSLKHFWKTVPEKREKTGFCLANLKIRVVDVVDDKYMHSFVRLNADSTHVINDFTNSELKEQNYVIINTNTRINICSGFVRRVEKDVITVSLDKDISQKNPEAVFSIDKYQSSTLLAYNLVNIAGLLEDNDVCGKLRNIIIDKIPARYDLKLPRSIAGKGAEILYCLNKVQQNAVLRVLAAHDFVLIKGMPGTGKTKTLVAVIQLLAKLGNSVIITAHTHSAVDNILLQLAELEVDFIRLGSESRIHPTLKNKSESFLTAECNSAESLEAMYKSKNIVGVTCFGAYHAMLSKRVFDVCIVDESTQVLLPTVLKPLYSAKKFVLVGDPKQLPPVTRSTEARKLGLNESLFIRLDSKESTVILTLQYRMNSRIMEIANKLSYEDQLRAGSPSTANSTMVLEDPSVLETCEEWVKPILAVDLDNSVIMVNTNQTYPITNKKLVGSNPEEQKCSNAAEAAIVLHLCNILLEGGVLVKDIGIISPYKMQVNLLKRIIQPGVEINTVDQFQGRDKSIIIYSCAKSSPPNAVKKREFDILEDHQRLTVAVTRAKHKLIVIGDCNTLKWYSPFNLLFSCLREKDTIELTDGRMSFSWDNLLQKLPTSF
ncbi:DNA replication ATP-dependent helicase/nuclease DNA2 isoform X2 [Orussus abietinus]|uniref:DNA replication ATP-dependent helicase/nuclease DNA2 isoform X2 n=1 Tax=Orussus abietinus TaxID=222816 RepID=UPI0006266F54|nr:DNA replication ATP-dependent helicase/nuclease DNA2 isoform X2 [Orussus abietinus]